jgi:hypothetical protein
MQAPGFPRRGIPIQKPAIPARPEAPLPFFRTASGRRMLLYIFALVALAGTMIQGVGKRNRAAQEAAAESRPAELTSPPRSFVSKDLLHQIRTLEDFTPEPPPAAIGAAIGYLNGRGSESRPAVVDWTWLDIAQSLAHPAEFRGGLVRIRGLFAGMDTRVLNHPAVPDPEGFTYRGWLYTKTPGGDAMVTFQTASKPPDFEKEAPIELEGVFLQAIEYESKKGSVRTAPFLVVDSVRPAPPEDARGFLDTLFVPIIVVLIILILATTLFLFRKSRRPASPRYTARPPGPER